MKKSLVIFDMDGTLIDSSLTISNSINHVRKNLYLEPLPHEQIISKINDHSIDPAKYFYASPNGFTTDHHRWFNEYYTKNHASELRLYDGVKDMLEWLDDRGIKIALATNAYHQSTVESLSNFGIDGYFDAVVCVDDVKEGKPAPDMLYKILDITNIDKESAIFIGDGPRDEEAADNAGIDYLMVDWGFTKHDNTKSVISNIPELITKLKSFA